jgi:nucleotide-binding universal stress UspA family protein
MPGGPFSGIKITADFCRKCLLRCYNKKSKTKPSVGVIVMPFEKIIVAFDGSKASRKALNKALSLVEDNPNAVLDVLHVVPRPTIIVGEAMFTPSAVDQKEYYEYSEKLVKEVEGILAGIPNSTNVVKADGQPAKTILDYAHNNGYDLIVVGSRGLGNIREFVLGSVSHNVVQNARIPVLVVK